MFALPNEEKPILSNLLSMNRRKIGSEVTRKIYMSRSPSKKQKKCMGSLGKGS